MRMAPLLDLGELGLGGTYQLTNHLAFRAGYQALWLEGVALSRQAVLAHGLVSLGVAKDISSEVFKADSTAG